LRVIVDSFIINYTVVAEKLLYFRRGSSSSIVAIQRWTRQHHIKWQGLHRNGIAQNSCLRNRQLSRLLTPNPMAARASHCCMLTICKENAAWCVNIVLQ